MSSAATVVEEKEEEVVLVGLVRLWAMDPELEESIGSMESSWTLLSWLASCVMVFGGAVPYIPQYQEIQKTSNTEGFSTRVCLVLLIANILRIFFWWVQEQWFISLYNTVSHGLYGPRDYTTWTQISIYRQYFVCVCVRVGKQFELTLLVQSVVMILTMLAMLHLCCTVQISNRVSTKQHRISGNDLLFSSTPPLLA